MTKFSYQIKLKTVFLILLLVLASVCPTAAFDRQTPVVQAVHRVSPAVVNISSEFEVRRRTNPFGFDPLFDSFFRDFFLDQRREKRSSLGSGVIIDGKRGFILTNAHVIEKRATIHVLLNDEREFEAKIVGVDADSDLAVLRISADTDLPAIAMGSSADIMIGETVIAIGNPFGFSHTVTTGVISAINRSIKSEERVYHEFIQTDASINPGNSGGPLLNINGELIGINTAIYAKAQGIGFAIPIDKAKRIVNDLIQFGHVVPAWLGIMVQNLDARMAQYLNLQQHRGVIIAQVEEDSPASKAGLEEGDSILAVGRRKITNRADYLATMRGIQAGEKIQMNIWRDNRQQKIQIQTTAFPQARAPELTWRRMGIKVKNAQDQGVTITRMHRDSYLAHIGVAPGDVIKQIDDISITDTQTFFKAMVQCRRKQSVVILLMRRGQHYYLTVKMAP